MNIVGINVRTYKFAVNNHDHTEISSVNSAKMSIPYSIAAAIVNRSAGLCEFDESAIHNADTIALTTKITVLEDDELTSLFPAHRAAVIQIHKNNGQVYERRIDFPLGEPENPLTIAEIEEKFVTLARGAGQTNDTISRIITATHNMDTDFIEWMEAIQECNVKEW
jgi:2-methylcitrate dehydratase PrpD